MPIPRRGVLLFVQQLSVILILVAVLYNAYLHHYVDTRTVSFVATTPPYLTSHAVSTATHTAHEEDVASRACNRSCCELALYASRPTTRRRDGQPIFFNLTAGELPGYTGWARPEDTLASFFEVDPDVGNNKPYVGEDWVVRLQCRAKQCAIDSSNRGALFYARAYGPAVVPGRVTGPMELEGPEASYTVSFHFFDPGTYFVEIVLTYSRRYAWDEYPLRKQEQKENFYEGYSIEGFPRSVAVLPSRSNFSDEAANSLTSGGSPYRHSPSRCTFAQLDVQNQDDPTSFARWKVVDRNDHHSHTKVLSRPLSLAGYQHGYNSIGLKMDYMPSNCSLIRQHDLVDRNGKHVLDACLSDRSAKSGGTRLRIILIGDSVMDQQETAWSEFMCGMTNYSQVQLSSRIPVNGGLLVTIKDIKEKLNSIRSLYPDERRIVLFNAGLHDAKTCGNACHHKLKKEMNFTCDNYRCLDSYRNNFQELVDFISSYDAQLKIFRTTTAGWPKYGNFGFAWRATQPQKISFSTHMVYEFNRVALDVVKKSKSGVHILDGFWLSLARPDHTCVQTNENPIGGHLVHFGPEVISVMNRQLLMLLLHDTCPRTLESWPISRKWLEL